MDKKNRDIFYGLIIVATLIIAIIGSTLAYFSYRTSSADDAIKARATTADIVYDDGAQVTAQASELMPSSLEVVKNVYQHKIANRDTMATSNICLDDEDKQVCSVYRFSVRSDIKRQVYAMLDTEYNGFTYLAYAVYDVTNKIWLPMSNGLDYSSLAKCSNKNNINTDDCYTQNGDNKKYSSSPKAINSIFGYNSDSTFKSNLISGKHVYDLVIFINENNRNQNIDQGKEYQGTIVVEITDNINNSLNN